MKIFSEETPSSNNAPYWPSHSCEKFERSLEPFWREGHKSKKHPLFRHLIPYNPGLRFFSLKNHCALSYNRAKNWEDP